MDMKFYKCSHCGNIVAYVQDNGPKVVCCGEEYEGIIKEVYNYIFIIKTDGNEVKSFSYRDVLTNTIELFFDKV